MTFSTVIFSARCDVIIHLALINLRVWMSIPCSVLCIYFAWSSVILVLPIGLSASISDQYTFADRNQRVLAVFTES